ncbi:MAG: HEPN domain-containing protein [Promethearchaeota archaeon]|nr:MAG: HEPN domain-containing protein [Candidatus Lokiarchaeota archaeon]
MNRYNDWLKQAEKDLEAAEDSEKFEHYEWTCFQAQQSAEKTLKALLLYLNIDSWGHGLVYLLRELKKIMAETNEEKDKEFDEGEYDVLKEKCQELDRHYIQPRYPNGFSSGYPAEYYNKKIASECLNHAKFIIGFVKKKIKEIPSS